MKINLFFDKISNLIKINKQDKIFNTSIINLKNDLFGVITFTFLLKFFILFFPGYQNYFINFRR